MRDVTAVVTGTPGLLAAHVVAEQLARSRRVGVATSAAAYARFLALLRSLSFSKDLRFAPEHLSHLPTLKYADGAEVWHFASTGQAIPRSLLAALQAANISALNAVYTPYCGGERWRWLITPQRPIEDGDPQSFQFTATRRFRTTVTIGGAPADHIAQEGVLHFLATLFDLKTEIEERVADFFDYHSLHCAIAPDASVNVLRVDDAAAMIATIADSGDGGDFAIASAGDFSGEQFLDRVGRAFDVSLLPSERGNGAPSFNQLDLLFERRLNDFVAQLVPPGHRTAEQAWRAANVAPARTVVDGATFDDLIAQARRQYGAAHRAISARVAVADTPDVRLARRADETFTYHSAGDDGEVIVLLNAFGQGLEAWSRLIEHLRPRFRVLTWTLRGLDDSEEPKSLADHVADLSAIIDQETTDPVHLIAWCTGPKIAIEYAAHHAERVRSLIFLNTTMKCIGSPVTLDTAYERNFELLCRALEQRPSMATSIVDSLVASGGANAEIGNEAETDASLSVLAAINRDLQKPVLRPFRDSISGLRYMRQLIDFWSHDVRSTAAQIDAPVLLFASEYDRVATPEASEWACQMFSRARLLRAQGATHYFLYDRADVVAQMIEWFVSNAAAPQINPVGPDHAAGFSAQADNEHGCPVV
jgi:pimeloyl-ACP methyl ester carboxylesterase